MRTIKIQAGQSVKIIGKFSNSIPTTYKFAATCLPIGQSPSGTVEVRGSNWVFSKPPTTQMLNAENTVSKTMWDTFYSVYVTPDQDVCITLENGKIVSPLIFIALVLGVVGIAAGLLMFGMQ